jgi:hypothetical protein
LLVRIEAAVVPLTALLVMLPRPTLRFPRFFAAASLCLLPYLAVGLTSPSDLIERLRGGAAPSETAPLNSRGWTMIEGITRCWGPDRMPVELGRKDSNRSSRFHGFAATLHEYGIELTQSFGFVLLPLVIAGLVARRRQAWSEVDALLANAAGLHLAIVFVMAWRGGYLSTRHFALPVVLTLPYAGLGMSIAARRLAEKTPQMRFQISNRKFEISDRKLQVAATTTFVVASLLVTLRPLHESHSAHQRAAQWITAQTQPHQAVLDQQGLTALISGRPTYRYEAATAALCDADLAYALIERADLEADTARGATLRYVLGTTSQAVVTFAAPNERRDQDVLVFSQQAPEIVAQGPTNHAR